MTVYLAGLTSRRSRGVDLTSTVGQQAFLGASP